jgi:collagenase-like PrtC family protease
MSIDLIREQQADTRSLLQTISSNAFYQQYQEGEFTEKEKKQIDTILEGYKKSQKKEKKEGAQTDKRKRKVVERTKKTGILK